MEDNIALWKWQKGKMYSSIGGGGGAAYWNAPLQKAAVGLDYDVLKTWTYAEYIAQYDLLVTAAPAYISKSRYEIGGTPVVTTNGSYELYSYTLTPSSYTKTIFIQAGIHGNEHDAKLQLLRFCQILVNEINDPGYEKLKVLRDHVRFVIVPIVSPYGHATGAMNVPYPGATYGINLNRNYDSNHSNAISGTGVGGANPFDMAETQHVRDLVYSIGAENIDYFMDWHDDGGKVQEHYWVNYKVDGMNRLPVMSLVNHLISKNSITTPVIPNCKDTYESGQAHGWAGNTMGMVSSTVEWIGGLLGYDFSSSQMTQSLELRLNMTLLAYTKNYKGNVINEAVGASFFYFDYPRAFTKNTLRYSELIYEFTVTDAMIYARWDALQAANSTYITKSAQLGLDCSATTPIHTYTLGSGATKVMFVGGVMRWGTTHRKIDEYAMYQLAEYLCDPDMVAQSAFLTDLKNNYTIIVLPFIDNRALNTGPYYDAGLNNQVFATRKRWAIVGGKCVPEPTYGVVNHAVIIIKALMDANQDLKCIVSGGEIMTEYALNNQTEYSTTFETHIVIPKNMTSNVGAYATHLTNNRNELVVVENTQGVTFGDYAYDQYAIPTYFVQLNVSKKFTELSAYHNLPANRYRHVNYEAGRRMANIVNLFTL